MDVRRTAITTALAGLALGLAAPLAHAGESEHGANPNTPNPLRGLRLLIDTEFHPAWNSYYGLLRRGRRDEARAVFEIAREPNFRWVGHAFERNPRRFVRLIFQKPERLGQPGAVPVITLFNHPHPKHQNPNSLGRRPDARKRYTPSRRANRRALNFIKAFSAAVGNRRIVLAFEPDSLGSMYLLSRRGKRRRIAYMREAIKIMAREMPNATIYAEGGASDWRHAKETARQLKAIGIRRIRGFMLNVTHFDTTGRSIAHGRKISRRLARAGVGPKPFVVSTHANGAGPSHYFRRIRGRRRRINVWCNPRNSALGERPQARSEDRVDGFLWIGRPGYSAGTCKRQPRRVTHLPGKRAGFWWEERGIVLGARGLKLARANPRRFGEPKQPLRSPTVSFGQ